MSRVDEKVERRLRRGQLDLIRHELTHPWAWPTRPDLVDELAKVGITQPELQAGEGLLVSWSAQGRGGVWRLTVSSETRGAGIQLGSAGVDAFRAAQLATSAALPILLRPIRDVNYRVEPLLGQAQALDGPSLGLTMALSLASFALELPLAVDLAATAAIDRDGTLSPVRGLEQKLKALASHAPQVRRLLVARTQGIGQAGGAALTAAGRELGIEVVRVDTLGAALETAFGVADLVSAVENHGDPEALADALVALTLRGHGAALRWLPVVGVARALRGRVRSPERVDFVRAVAARHEGWRSDDLAVFPTLEGAWFEQLPIYRRRAVLANALQHCADWGKPDPDKLLGVGRAWADKLDSVLHAELDDLRVLGALGRLEAYVGDFATAIERQRFAVAGWRTAGQLGEASFPVSSLLVWSGVLADRSLFDEAIGYAEALGLVGFPYIQLARGRSEVLLGITHSEETLAPLSESANVHLRLSAARWRLLAAPNRGASTALRAWMQRQEGALATVFQALVALDDANGDGDEAAVERAITALADATHPVWLERWAQALPEASGHRGERLARVFPY